MENFNLSKMGMSPLSTLEANEIVGGSFWSKLKAIHYTVLALADFMMLKPMEALGRGIGNGLQAGLKG